MVYVLLGDGFEELEAIAPVDLLRRAGINVKTVGVGSCAPSGTHQVLLSVDMKEEQVDFSRMEALVLIGGQPATTHLDESLWVQTAIAYAVEHQIPIGAICAAPSILGHAGVLRGLRAACYPGYEQELVGAMITDQPVVTDGLVTTARGAGVAIEFALELVARLASPETAQQIRKGIQCP